MGYPKTTPLLRVFLIFKTIFFLVLDSWVKEDIGMLMFLPSNWKNIVLRSNFYNFFFDDAVHYTKYVLLLIEHDTYFSMSFFIIVFITDSGKPMYEALRVKTAVSYSGVYCSLSSDRSSIPMNESLGRSPKPSSSGMSTHWTSLNPFSTYFAVISPIVIVWLSPR